jgi:PAS domain S-box-containing protein
MLLAIGLKVRTPPIEPSRRGHQVYSLALIVVMGRQESAIGVNSPRVLLARVEELSALFRLTDRLYRAKSLDNVFEAAMDAILGTLDCSRASILLFDQSGVMRFVAWRGLSESYRTTLEGHSPWKVGDEQASPIFVEDIRRTQETELVKETIEKEGIRALAFIPLVARGGVIGKFMVYYGTPKQFNEHEAELAITIARQVGFAIERTRAEEARRLAEHNLRESEERFRTMLEHAPVMIWISGPQGECLHLNKALRSFWGVEEAAIANFDWRSTMHPDDAAHIGQSMMHALATQTHVTIRGRYSNASGNYRILVTEATPRFASDGGFQGMIGVNVDVTEREQAEKALRDSETRFRLAVEAAPSGMVLSDQSGRIVLVNAHAERLFGYERDELIGKHIEVLVPKQFQIAHPAFRRGYGIAPTARPMGVGRDLTAQRKDGSEIPVEIGLSPIEAADGAMVLTAVVDISERKRADSQRNLLLAELDHRVKNTLAVVQGIAHQTFRGSNASAVAKAAFEGRLIALANAHNLLTRSSWSSALLSDIAADALHANTMNSLRVTLDGSPILLRPREALSLAMALHELSTNALKYGALSNEVGRVTLTWEITTNRLRIKWQEQNGPAVRPPKSRGFGSNLIEMTIIHDLDGSVELDFQKEGLICTLDVPIAGQMPAE